MSLEHHLIGELYDVEKYAVLESAEEMKSLLITVSRMIREEPLAVHVHEFEPYGLSGFLLMDRGYVAIHTWPEHSYACANVVSYEGEEWCWRTFDVVASLLEPKSRTALVVKSGVGLRRPT